MKENKKKRNRRDHRIPTARSGRRNVAGLVDWRRWRDFIWLFYFILFLSIIKYGRERRAECRGKTGQVNGERTAADGGGPFGGAGGKMALASFEGGKKREKT